MKIINIGRGKGKTSRIMALSETFGYPILCHNGRKQSLKLQAKEYGYKIGEVYDVSDLVNKRTDGKNIECMVVDEMPIVFSQLLSQAYDIDVSVATMTEVCL